MNSGGKFYKKKSEEKNSLFLNNQNYYKRNNSPIMVYNSIPYNLIDNISSKKGMRNTSLNETRNIQYPSYQTYFNNSNNYYLPSNQQYNKEDNKYKFVENISENSEKEFIIQKMKDFINQNEKKKEEQKIKDYYEHNLINNIDTYPNGINLSISNCETQYPINNINNDDAFFRKLKIFLVNYEKYDKKNNKTINNNNLISSYECLSQMLKNKANKTNNNLQKSRYINDSVEEKPYTYRKELINNKYNIKGIYSKNNNNLNKKIINFYKQQNKTCNNFHSIIKQEQNSMMDDLNFETYEEGNNTIRNIDENYLRKNENNKTNSRIKLMNIEIKKGSQNIYKNDYSPHKNRKNQNPIIGKNINEEKKFQEKLVSKMEIFIKNIERVYIFSFKKLFHYFKQKMKSYGKKNTKNIDCKNLLKRFQKSRNRKNLNNSTLSFINTNNSAINKLNKKLLSSSYRFKNKLDIIKSKESKNNISRDIYIPKNPKNPTNFSTNKNKNKNKNRGNKGITSNKSEYINLDNSDKFNLSTELNSKKVFSSSKKNNLIRISVNRKKNFIMNEINKNINNHIKNISSFDSNPKNDTIEGFNFNIKDIKYLQEKPMIYHKKKSRISNQKMMISKEKENKNNDNYKSPDRKVLNENYEYLNKTLENNNEAINSILIKNNTKCRSPIRPKPSMIKEKYKSFYEAKKNKINNMKSKKEMNDDNLEQIIVKDIFTYDKRLFVFIKYLSSESLNDKYTKMKIKRKMINLNDNKNKFRNKECRLLKPIKLEQIEIIPPITSLKPKIKDNNNKIGIILEEKEDYNFSYKILEMIKAIQKFEKLNKFYIYKYFFDILKIIHKSDIITLAKMVPNNFQKLNDLNIKANSNIIFEDNKNEIENYNNSENNNRNLKLRKKNHIKNRLWKRNIFLNAENSFINNGIWNNLNKSDINEISDISENLNCSKHSLNLSDNMPKNNSFRVKITKYRIKERKKYQKKIKTKKDILKEDEEMRKKSMIMFLINNRFSYYNNCLRLIKTYFRKWKSNNLIKKSENIIKNNKENKIINDIGYGDNKIIDISFGVNDNKNILNINRNRRKKDKNKDGKNNIKEDEDESNIINNENSKDRKVIEKKELIGNNKDLFNSPLYKLNRINIGKRIHNDSFQDSKRIKSFPFDKNELEEKVDYFRNYLIINYAFKKSNGCSEEEKEE